MGSHIHRQKIGTLLTAILLVSSCGHPASTVIWQRVASVDGRFDAVVAWGEESEFPAGAGFVKVLIVPHGGDVDRTGKEVAAYDPENTLRRSDISVQWTGPHDLKISTSDLRLRSSSPSCEMSKSEVIHVQAS